MKILAITQARSGSSRLPGKVLKKIKGKTLLQIHVERILTSRLIDKLIIATTTEPADIQIVDEAKALGVPFFRGSENDVLDRFYQTALPENPDFVVRLTSDCPLIDGALIDKVIQHTLDNGVDYGSNTLDPTYPDGQDNEVVRFSALQKAWKEATLASDREHVTPYIWRNSSFKGGNIFTSSNFEGGSPFGHQRMTVDEPRDYEFISKVIESMGTEKTWDDYARFIANNPTLTTINHGIKRNEGYKKSTDRDE